MPRRHIMMHWGDYGWGMGYGWMGFGWIWMLVIMGLTIAGVVYLVQTITQRTARSK